MSLRCTMLSLLLLLMCFHFAASQTWRSFGTGNYAGISGAALQPASIAGAPYKLDVNIFGVTLVGIGEEYLHNLNVISNVKSSVLNIPGLAEFKSNQNSISLFAQMPSFLIRIDSRKSFGFSWNIRALNYNVVSNSSLFNLYGGSFEEVNLGDYSDEFYSFIPQRLE